MNIKMDEKTRRWLEERGGICTVHLVAFPGQISNKRLLVDFECHAAPPENPEVYYRLELNGTVVYLHKDLQQKKQTIEMRVCGREPFKFLDVKGFKRLFTETA